MKDFRNWGIKIRRDTKRNYYALWENLRTTRLDLGKEIKLPYERSEFYDVGITEKCNAMCDFCYVSADSKKQNYTGISETWKRWMDTFPEDQKIDVSKDPVFKDIIGRPEKGEGLDELELKLMVLWYIKNKLPIRYTSKCLQACIGSTGEPTIHPEFTKFLETVYMTDVVPNYTTNGIILGEETRRKDEILEATRNFVGGVAVSYGNKKIRDKADKAIENLLKDGECKVMIHHLIKDKTSVDELLEAEKKWGKDIHYHVLLPQKAHGRSTEEMDEETYLYLCEKIKGYENLAFGMWFLPWMKKFPGSIKCWDYPGETYSANLLLKNEGIQITRSSYDLRVVKEIKT